VGAAEASVAAFPAVTPRAYPFSPLLWLVTGVLLQPSDPVSASDLGAASLEAHTHEVVPKSRLTRRLTFIDVAAGDDLVAEVNRAASGAELILADGTYLLSGSISIAKDITIRAQNSGMAVLDGGDAVRVMSITGGTVLLDGLVITRGRASVSLAPAPAPPRWMIAIMITETAVC
jgi:hypothetical protein